MFQTSLEVTKKLHHIKLMTPKSDFLPIWVETITPNGSINAVNFGKNSLFNEQDYEQQRSTSLWSVRVNK